MLATKGENSSEFSLCKGFAMGRKTKNSRPQQRDGSLITSVVPPDFYEKILITLKNIRNGDLRLPLLCFTATAPKRKAIYLYAVCLQPMTNLSVS